MTADKDLKKLVRARAARTGQSYAAARRSVVGASPGERPASATSLWFARGSQGYKGKGAKPSGFEHHEIVRSNGALIVRCVVAFSNYGVHAYEIVSDASSIRSTYEYGGGEIVITASFERGEWRAVVGADGEQTEVRLDTGAADPIPSVAARFLPLLHGDDPRGYVPVPEDAFPAWSPSGPRSWFPVMGVAREPLVEPRIVARRGTGAVAGVKGAPKAVPYDHVNAAGVVRATTWLSEDGDVVAYEQAGCVLRAVSEDEARALDPREARG